MGGEASLFRPALVFLGDVLGMYPRVGEFNGETSVMSLSLSVRESDTSLFLLRLLWDLDELSLSSLLFEIDDDLRR